jgi:hypothetical protein
VNIHHSPVCWRVRHCQHRPGAERASYRPKDRANNAENRNGTHHIEDSAAAVDPKLKSGIFKNDKKS